MIHVSNYFELASRQKLHSGYEPFCLQEIWNSLSQDASTASETIVKPQFSECSDMESYLKLLEEIEFPVKDHLEFPFSSESKYRRLPLQSMLCPKGRNLDSVNI